MNEVIVHQPTKSEFKRMAMQLGYEPVRHGHWVEVREDDDFIYLQCSICGYSKPERMHNYCPNCGAKMIKVSE